MKDLQNMSHRALSWGILSINIQTSSLLMTRIQEWSQHLAGTAAYFNGWEVYQKVIQYNYMEHIEITEIICKHLISHHYSHCSFLDLGCGDASFSARLVSNLEPISYTGIDLSSPALELARNNLSTLGCNITLAK
jgi:methylase of polypeptide subunit release factors